MSDLRNRFVRDGAVMLPLHVPSERMPTDAAGLAAFRDTVSQHTLVVELLGVLEQRGKPEVGTLPPTARLRWHTDHDGLGPPVRHPVAIGGTCELLILVAVDPFTHENDATEIMLRSHIERGTATAWRAVMPAGDAVAFLPSHALHRRDAPTNVVRRAIGIRYRGTWIGARGAASR